MEWWLDGVVAHPFNEGVRLRTTVSSTEVEGAGWGVAVHVRAANGRLIIDELEVRPAEGTEYIAAVSIDGRLVLPGGPTLSLATARREITDMVKRDLEADPEASDWAAMWRLALGFWGPELRVTRPGRKGLASSDHALIAAAYVEALRREPGQPYATMRNLLQANGRHYSESSLPRAVSNARRLGYLTDAPAKGRSGGDLTEQTKAVLREAGFEGFPQDETRIPNRQAKERAEKSR